MFGALKKKLSDSIKSLSKKIEEMGVEKVSEKDVEKTIKKETEKESKIKESKIKTSKEVEPQKEIKTEKGGLFQKTIKEKDIEDFFHDIEIDLLESNIALEVVDEMKSSLKKSLVGKSSKLIGSGKEIKEAFEKSLVEILDQGKIDIDKIIKEAKKENNCACFIFLGFNGSGKTTSIAKLAQFLTKKGYRVVLAAADTFRAASIEQIEYHAEKLNLKVIKHQYGADSAAVIFDAVKHGSKNGYDVVLADTAGRSHADKNLMDELKKIVRVNKPQLKILVIDSLTGNDAVEQAKSFNDAVGVDAVVLTKTDVDNKGGSILSVCHTIKKPILFLGTGQKYDDIDIFNPEKFVEDLLGD